MVTVGLFIKTGQVFKRIELFSDEKISVTSSIQNISDISKVFTDFSQTFNVPASIKNNEIFKYWYENSLDNGFDARKRAEAYIELDTISFRIGKLQLESVDLKNNKPNGYKLTFFGNLISLKDTFNGLLMKDLTAGTFDFEYNDAIVRTKLTTQTNSDIKFPLISSLRPWNYGSGNVNDISLVANTIAFGELFPAIRLRAIFDLIATKFNITFAGFDSVTGFNPNAGFLKQDARFLNAYLLLKNSEVFNVLPSTININLDTINGGDSFGYNIDLVNETFRGNGVTCDFQSSLVTITPITVGVEYNIHTFKNGIEVLKQTFTSTTTATRIINLTAPAAGGYGTIDIYNVKISSLVSFNFNATLALSTDATEIQVLQNSSQTIGTNNLIPIASYLPDLKIEDFFSGILKMFNLTCFSNVAGVFIVEQLETFYAQGKTIAIDKYIVSDATNIERTKPFNIINFKYQKSESLLSTAFLSNNRLDYGDLKAEFDVDGSEFAITLPFENPLFSAVSPNLSAGFLFKNDTRAYIPKPIVLYDYGTLQTAPAFFINGTSTTTYNAFGAESLIGTKTFSLNFGVEQSPMTNDFLSNTLFSEYYSAYLNNIFNIKARIFKINAVFPVSILTSIKLNDRIVIRDKRYTINSIETNLSTREVSLELITDFRELTTYIPPPVQDKDYLNTDYSTDYNV
jgi:hypothetical protein